MAAARPAVALASRLHAMGEVRFPARMARHERLVGTPLALSPRLPDHGAPGAPGYRRPGPSLPDAGAGRANRGRRPAFPDQRRGCSLTGSRS